MAKGFNWEITLADDSVKKEALGDKFNLAWENTDAVKKIKFVGFGGIADNYEVDFSTGKFYKNSVQLDAGIGVGKNLIFRKRSQVRVDETGALPLGTTFLAGYNTATNTKKILVLSPQYTVGQGTDPTSFISSFTSNL